MDLFTFETWFTLFTGFAIYIIGLRVFWLDSNNRMYQTFMLVTFFLFVQNMIYFIMGQIVELPDIHKLRMYQEASRNIATIFVCMTSWFYAKRFVPKTLSKLEYKWFLATLIISFVLLVFQIFTSFGHGELFLDDQDKWVIKIIDPNWKDWIMMMWYLLLYSTSIYFAYLPFKYAYSRSRWRISGLILITFLLILFGAFTKNFILTIFFQIPSLLNESIILAFIILFGRILIVKLHLNDLNSDYVIPSLLKNMTNWFVITDSDFNISRVNSAFLQNMGKDIDYWHNYPINSLFDTTQWNDYIEKAKSSNNRNTIECEFRVNDGQNEYYFLFAITPVLSRLSFFPFRRNKVTAYVFVGTNFSQFKASEIKSKNYAKELESSVQALESFAFIASHDLKEPIRNIGSFTGLLKRDLGDAISSNASEYLQYIEKSVKGMNQLVNSIMAVSRVGRKGLNFELIDMNKLLLQRKEEFKTLFKKNNAQVITEKLPAIYGDHQLIQQLVQNLIENSVKYNTSELPEIHIYSTPGITKDQILIKIQDNGIGIEPEYREQVFQMFKRLHSRQTYEGTGVGLAICKRIMELHKGQIWIEDARNGNGTTFVLSFPSYE